jgi:hypothetical protein
MAYRSPLSRRQVMHQVVEGIDMREGNLALASEQQRVSTADREFRSMRRRDLCVA